MVRILNFEQERSNHMPNTTILVRLYENQNHCCSYCGRNTILPSDLKDSDDKLLMATVDHIVPLSKGGKSNGSNYVMSCDRCNNLKGDTDEETFRYALKEKGKFLNDVIQKRSRFNIDFFFSRYKRILKPSKKVDYNSTFFNDIDRVRKYGDLFGLDQKVFLYALTQRAQAMLLTLMLTAFFQAYSRHKA